MVFWRSQKNSRPVTISSSADALVLCCDSCAARKLRLAKNRGENDRWNFLRGVQSKSVREKSNTSWLEISATQCCSEKRISLQRYQARVNMRGPVFVGQRYINDSEFSCDRHRSGRVEGISSEPNADARTQPAISPGIQHHRRARQIGG